ncbi:mitochondrial escape protein 2 [Oleoguttula sp. CCFEE 5521]
MAQQQRAIQRLNALTAQLGGGWTGRASSVRKRYSSGEAGDDKSGHIKTSSTESVLFFNNLLPINLQWLFRIPWTMEKVFPKALDQNKTSAISAVNPGDVLDEAIKANGLTGVKVLEVLPRFKEGGAYLKFSHDESISSTNVADAVRAYLKQQKFRPWWNPLNRVQARLVIGKPWVEDLFRLPSSRIRCEFLPTSPGAEVAELSQEQLYSFFRPYGKLVDIVTQPSDSKIVPRYAYLDFSHKRKAIMAKNCLHGYTIDEPQGGGKLGTIFRLTYEKKARFGWIREWIFGHPRLMIPLLAALVAGITVAVFDPLRTLAIKAHITRAFHVEDNFIWRWVKTQGEDLIDKVKSLRQHGGTDEAGMQVVWDDRRDQIEQIQAWLMESVDTFIIVQGPRGSGKKELVVDHALKQKREAHKLLIVDCKPIQEARGDTATINAAAGQVGYRPVFSWFNSISGLIDLAAQGTTGVKTGFSETLENQLVKIWNNTASALKSIALEDRKKDDKDSALSDDEYLEAHPERRPVVVVDNFLHKGSDPGAELVYDKLAEWAARLSTGNIAHVIFLTNDVSYSKSLSKALPDRVFRQISLGDCSPEVAKRYVINHLDFDADDKEIADGSKKLTPSQKRNDLNELDSVIALLGGRLTDLEFLARRIKAGETPNKAVKEMIDQGASEVIKMYINSNESRKWTNQQAWSLIKGLAKNEALRYNEVLLADAFGSGGEEALAALEQAELISIQTQNGRPHSIKAGRPIYAPAFKQLTDDHVLSAKMELSLLGQSIGAENKSIDKYEQELHLLAKLPGQPAEIKPRIYWLLGKIQSSQGKVEGYEKEAGEMKKLLSTEF